MNRKNILILEPERDVCELFARVLESGRICKCYAATREEEANELLGEIPFDLLFVDVGLLAVNGFYLLKRLRRLYPEAQIIVDAYLHQREDVRAALGHGAQNFVLKPINIRQFREKIQSIMGAVAL